MMLIFQLAVIIGLARLLRKPVKMIGLPPVIGEMLVGFLLGPTIFGAFAPQAFNAFFSRESIQQIGKLATLIVATYCFVIGLEFDTHHLQGRRAALTITALVSALLPALTGYIVAGYFLTYMTLASTTAFKLSVALCFAVTAFPVLLRIVEDAGISNHPTGIFSIGVSAVLELIIWASLPIILAFASAGNLTKALPALAWVTGFLVLWFSVVRPGLRWAWARIPYESFASFILLVIVGIGSAYLTEKLGIHAIFGAFVGGLIVPREVSFKLAKKIKTPIVFLLPIFFAAAGLKTTLSLGSEGKIILLLAIAVLAYVVKGFGTAIAAKLTGGLDWNDAITAGHLMCAKGAIGFAIIESCLSAGLLDSQGYSMLAFVVLANTIMSAWGVLLHRRMVSRIDSGNNRFMITEKAVSK